MDRLSRPQLAAYAAIAVAVLVLGGRWLMGHGAGSPAPAGASSSFARDAEPPPTASSAAADEPRVESPSRAAVVHVAGAVRHPGVYRLAAGARVRDAVRRAGGAARRGDVNAINLAAQVQDGVQIVVPRRVPAGGAAAAAGPSSPEDPSAVPTAPINLNTATAEQLETLDGVGPATAAKILEYRRAHGGFRTIDDLGQVSGIGPKRLEAIRDRVVA